MAANLSPFYKHLDKALKLIHYMKYGPEQDPNYTTSVRNTALFHLFVASRNMRAHASEFAGYAIIDEFTKEDPDRDRSPCQRMWVGHEGPSSPFLTDILK